ncbi:hypothetical protein G7Z17_g2497 [Cylindrodendrum hubeiense]|uniref:HD domain-containing protein n=1 Tax=Cylindrodendrum hubeiense TaxID=595255 RepID=A0A9P5HHL3_9HYPO|nr:hypothetical protein G7Z17_g2497 [Cylindrodendrum hubeiense]
MYHKLASLLHLLLVAFQVQLSTQAHVNIPGRVLSSTRNIPKRTLAGVSVVDTPVVRAADNYARQYLDDFAYKHVMRTWLFGVLIIEHNATLRNTVDVEVHAVSALLHDMGWDITPGSPFVSPDKRFEVDGAIAAREFLGNNKHGKHWDDRRVQLVWDSIALHTQPSLFNFKELEVMTTGSGISSDFVGPLLGITEKEYTTIVAEFPNEDMLKGYNDTITWFCQSKPSTTYDTWMQPWGENYVHNYSAKGHRMFDVVPVFAH